MKKPWLIRRLIRKVSNFFRGTALVMGRLLGVRRVSPEKLDGSRLVTAGWVFMLGIPMGLVLLGTQFPISTWLVIVLGLLAIVNLDDALLLTSQFAEHGVDGEIEEIPT